MKRRAKIIATIGPASHSIQCLRRLAQEGMDIARLNFSHGDHEEHTRVIHSLRQLSQELNRPIGILQDLQGPKLRTGEIADCSPVTLLEGQRVILTTADIPSTPERIHVNYPFLPRDVQPNDRVLLDDGQMELQVLEVRDQEVETKVIVGGKLSGHKGVNLPGVDLSAPPLSEKDREDLALGLSHEVDAIAMSFVRRPSDLVLLRETMDKLSPNGKHIPIIAKLERPEAVDRLEEILDECEGVMVARGDLGVEVSPEKVPSIQKYIIQQANLKRKLVITATQMLESMIHHPRPTRAEASDVANAVFDGSDVLMLSGETAIGEYPINALQTMVRIIEDAEMHSSQWGVIKHESTFLLTDDATATTHAARELAHDREVTAVAVFTRSGRTARLMSKARPRVPILAFTPDQDTYYQLAMLWGVEPHLIPMANSVEIMIRQVETALISQGRISPGQQVVLVASLPIGRMGPANFTYLHTMGEQTT